MLSLDEKMLRLLDEIVAWHYEDAPAPEWKRALWLRNEVYDKIELPALVKKVVWETAHEWYSGFFNKRGYSTKEPEVFVARLRETFGMQRMPERWAIKTPRQQRQLILKALNSLTAEGKLRTSIGEGFGKRETRMWDVPRELIDVDD